MEENLPPPQVPVNPVLAPVPPAPPLPPKKFSLNLILIILIITVIFSTGALFAVKNQPSKQTPSPSPQPPPTSTPTPTPDPTANWKTYDDLTFGYSFKYPANYKPYINGGNVFYSSDAQFDKVTTAKTHGIDIGSIVYGPGEDTQKYIGPNTIVNTALVSKLALPPGSMAKAYVNTEDITVTIDYKKNNKNMRIMIWCGGENGNSSGCKNVLTPLLSTFKFTDSNQKSPVTPKDEVIQNDKKCADGICILKIESGQSCGRITDAKCPIEYTCELDGSHPDAGGKCVKE